MGECYFPLTGRPGPDGKLAFTRMPDAMAQALSGSHTTIPCGRCIGCKLEHSRQWAVRLVHEKSMHDKACMITLTYDREHLPFDWSLDLSHWQLFAKKLRKERGSFRFYMCGEYGGAGFDEHTQTNHSGRPHYHAILFNEDFSDDRKEIATENDYPEWVSPTLNRIWGKGRTRVGQCTFESAAYVARYVTKKITGPKAASHYHGRKPEFSTMSRRPGIGKTWITKFKSDVYPADNLVINGVKTKPPRYYDQQLPEHELLAIKLKRQALADAQPPSESTRPRKHVKHMVKKAQLAQNAKTSPL